DELARVVLGDLEKTAVCGGRGVAGHSRHHNVTNFLPRRTAGGNGIESGRGRKAAFTDGVEDALENEFVGIEQKPCSHVRGGQRVGVCWWCIAGLPALVKGPAGDSQEKIQG